MTVAFESGYTLPGGDLPLNHARMLHRGNRFHSRLVSASAEATGFDATAADNAMTDDAWKPFSNEFDSPSDFSTADWTEANLTVGSDNQTLTETAATGAHSLTYTGTALSPDGSEYVIGVRVKVMSFNRILALVFRDSASAFHRVYVDFAAGTVTNITGTMNGDLYDVGNGEYLVSAYYTPASGALTLASFFFLEQGTFASSFAGDTTQTLRIIEVSHHKSTATWDFEGFSAEEGDVFCVAAHNVGSGSGRLAFSHDSNTDDTYTSIGTVSPADDSPVMFIHEGITSSRWRITVDRCPLPRIGVIRIGKLLQWERPFYGGFSPAIGNRQTVMRGNMSIGGQWLGRTKVRTGFATQYAWSNLSQQWVRDNLLGVNGALRALEDEPFFIAWRSSAESDCDYAWTSGQGGWANSGIRDLTTFAIDAESYGYE